MRFSLVSLLHHAVSFFRDTPFESILAALTTVGVIWAAKSAIATKWRQWRDRKYLRSRLGAELFTPEEILASMKWYVEPDCQNIDPSGGEEWRRTAAVRQNAFSALDRLFHNSEYRHSILLADSGMGKTSLLLNYYARSRRHRHQMALAIVPLGYPHHEEVIRSIADKANTVLFLDAFDEDTRAAKDHRGRLAELLELTSEFRNVLITCRTQFFRTDDEIPRETGIVRFGPTRAGQEHEYVFYKLYLSPFADGQIEEFLRKRWPFVQRTNRLEAKNICARLGDLTVRPLVLTYLDALIGKERSYKYTFQIYEEIINSWLMRERNRVNVRHLYAFSKRLAIEIYCRREQLGGERLPAVQAESLARQASLSLEELEIRVRSLLNRDAEGRLKFAHRSIMEYLYVRGFIDHPEPQPLWTDQMRNIFLEIALYGETADLQKARAAAIHTDSQLRKELIERILDEQPDSLFLNPVSVGTVRFLRDNEFLLILERADGSLSAVSKRRLPHDFVRAMLDEFQLSLAVPVLGENSYSAKHRPQALSIAEQYHRAAFGSDWAGLTWTPPPRVDSPDYSTWQQREKCIEFLLTPAVSRSSQRAS